ncbi:unnamed protein product [Cylicostephanus goldi]|uniref:Uncharacterized protein n=1 Tax=Cylicostephanus goldi TaxID=71465 RepID=A0A3P6SXC9_CYLGO|nr:unnamed protein product [Cylicostephanus goldi]
MKATMNEIRAIVDQQAAARLQQQQQKQQELQTRMNQIKSDIMARKDDLDVLEQELRDKYAQYQQKQLELKQYVTNALLESVKASVVMDLGNKIQDTLDRKALQQVLSENRTLLNGTMAAPKATVLDE